jgi:putative thioredoxin
MTDSPWIVDVAEADFEREVLARSDGVPVVIDFWAPWCGPCRTLGPLLERLAVEHAGAFVLAKVDVDQAPQVAAHFSVRSVPTVVGVRDGSVRAEFVGAQPEAAVRAFLERVLPSEADERVAEAAALAAAGDVAAASEKLRAALAVDARHGRALVMLAQLLASAEKGAPQEAVDLLDHVLPHDPAFEDAERLSAQLRLRSGGAGAADSDALRAAVEAAPDDLAARIAWGRALAAGGRHEEALETLLEAVRRDPTFDDQAARKAMLDLFELLGPAHEATQRYRGLLARVLFV